LIEAVDQFVLPFIDSLYGRFGYVGVVIAMAIESAAIPIPPELILPFAGWSVSRGVVEPLTGAQWTYWGAVIAGVLGNTVGSLVSYAVGAFGGRPLLERYGRYVLISAHDLETADRWFARWGDLTVLFRPGGHRAHAALAFSCLLDRRRRALGHAPGLGRDGSWR